MPAWVDFKELRRQLSFEAILRHYGVEIKAKGDQHHDFCPLPTHQGEKRSPSFSANLQKGIFQCFGCGAKGNLIDFAAYMEKLDPKKGEDVRKVALMLQERFCPALSQQKKEQAKSVGADATKPQKAEKKSEIPVVVNAPLEFTLKQLIPEHRYLSGRGFKPETVSHFGLGFCLKGLLTGRIAIPLHDQAGQLVGYAGRLVDNAAVSQDNPKYLFPSKRERKGVVHEFEKSLFLYNGHRITAPIDDLIVVEGFPSVWWLWQSGFRNIVALMGWSCSEEQAKLIVSLVKTSGRVWVFPDGDEAGERCATSVLTQVASHRFCRWVKVALDKQPTDCSPDELGKLLQA